MLGFSLHLDQSRDNRSSFHLTTLHRTRKRNARSWRPSYSGSEAWPAASHLGKQSTFNRSWLFRDGARVTFVCAQLPAAIIGPFGDPENPNYTKLQTYADIDALMELFGHIRAENPAATVHFMTPPDVAPDDLSGHVVLLGGVVWNEITGRLSEMAKLPVSQVKDPRLESGEIFVADVDGKERLFWPKWADEEQKVLTEDVGLLARVPNPLNANRTLTICNGIHSRGVYGAVRTLTDAELRDGNERFISETLRRCRVVRDTNVSQHNQEPDDDARLQQP